MLIPKFLMPLFVLFLIQGVSSKPIEDEKKEGHGILSTVWGWITYPFTWWTYGDVEELPATENPVPPSSPISTENIEIGKRNVTVWCNDQTCTTMKCDTNGCVNITCNIYDTDLRGECREYNMSNKEDQYETTQSILEPKPTTEANPLNSTIQPTAALENDSKQNKGTEVERPLELEAVISSSVLQQKDNNQIDNNRKNKTTSSPQNKIK